MEPKPTHVYIAREKNCGCVTGLATADSDKFTAQWVAEFIKTGRLVNLVAWEMYVNEVSQEGNFMACPHQEPHNNQNPGELLLLDESKAKSQQTYQ